MEKFDTKYGFTEEEWECCLKVLQTLKENPIHNPDNQKFGTLLTKISKKAKKQLNRNSNHQISDTEVIKSSVIARNALQNTTFFGEESEHFDYTFTRIKHPIKCYACFENFQEVHSFYHRLCPKCAKLNFYHRSNKVDLTGRNVLLTGGRVKVGYAAALKFLRCNANLTITTRFPALAYHQFKEEKDFETWKDRLFIYGLDLRMLKEVERFIAHYFESNSKLDILVNNAAQTIKYDHNYYQKLNAAEQKRIDTVDRKMCLLNEGRKLLKEIEHKEIDIHEEFNRFGQYIDNRNKNSWFSKLEEIDIEELLEVNLINHISPYLLIKGLLPLLKASDFKDRFIINVSSSEGQFSYSNKTVYHPHTNMTKAALNMLTLTSYKDFLNEDIYMNSVDVGWISTGATESLRKKQFERGYIPPLDPVDGASVLLFLVGLIKK